MTSPISFRPMIIEPLVRDCASEAFITTTSGLKNRSADFTESLTFHWDTFREEGHYSGY